MNLFNKHRGLVRDIVVDGLEIEDMITGSAGNYVEYIIKDGKTGRIITQGHNITVLGGRIAQLEELFDISRNTTQHLLINDMLGIPHSESATVLSSKTIRRGCNYFMVGDGAASTKTPGKYYTPKNYETKLYNAIPFRLVPLSSDLSTTEREKYRMRKVETIDGIEYAAYYAKKFSPGSVILEYNTSSYLPIASHTVPVDKNDVSHALAGGSVLAYIQFTLDIEATEIKEYFKVHNGSLTGASMSEIGLVYGADLTNTLDSNRSELAAAELLSKITSSSVDLSTDSSSRNVTYKIYAR